MTTLTVADVVGLLEQRYPPRTAESWDAVGLVAGDPAAPVRSVLLAVDPVRSVVDEAIARGVDLLITHHPLYLRGTSSVAATGPKGRIVHDLIRAGCALYTAHTNADAAAGGVAEALADLLDLRGRRPIVAHDAAALDTLTVFVPQDHTGAVLDALADAGAGAIGEYDRCAFTVPGQGTFRASEAANPTIGERGQITEVAEDRLEMTVPRHRRAAVVAALRASHPYEEPAFSVLEHAVHEAGTGLGRIGTLPSPTTLRELAEHVAAVLPLTAPGIRVAGEPRCTPSRSPAGPATRSSAACASWAPMSTSPRTCATIPPPRRSRAARPTSSTPPTGPASGPGCPTRPPTSPRTPPPRAPS